MELRVIVADDESIARRRIVRLVEETGHASVVAQCAGGADAVARTLELDPHVLFLDVQMPDLDGFAVIAALPPGRVPAVVFVTAFDRYAQRAFEVHAVDYLLKPYDTARFRDAFDRVRERVAMRSAASEEVRLRELLREYLGQEQRGGVDDGPLERVAVSVDGSLRIVRTADVDWWETEGNYVRLHVGAASHVIRETAAHLESRLPRQFVRIHRRYLVNIDRIAEVQPWFSGDAIVILQSGEKLRLSRSHRERLYAMLLGGRAR